MRALSFACLSLLACGSRTGLEVPLPPAADAGAPLSTPDAGLVVSFAPDCADVATDWILFDLSSPDGGVFAERANGEGLQRVDLPHGPARFPSVSPDGKDLLYATFSSAGGAEEGALYLYDLTTHDDRLIVKTPDLTYSALSPDHALVAYVSDYTLRALRADGTGDHALLVGPDSNGLGYGHPVFADATTVVYGGGDALGSIHADGTGNETLFSETVGFHYPNAAFSADHGRLVAGTLCSPTAPWALRVFDFADLPAACESGTVLADVDESSSPNGANDPSWNPGGPMGPIAYASGQDVFVIAPSGGTPVNMTQALTNDETGASDPVWAPACAVLP